MTRRRLHSAITLLLPLMVLRALLPSGYMPVVEGGALRIAMCSDGLYAADAQQKQGQTPDSGHNLPSDSATCPFAHAAVNAAPPAVSPINLRIDSEVGIVHPEAVPTRTASVVRVQSARGPPSSSM
jgi:hypothetical protein